MKELIIQSRLIKDGNRTIIEFGLPQSYQAVYDIALSLEFNTGVNVDKMAITGTIENINTLCIPCADIDKVRNTLTREGLFFYEG